MKTVIARFLPPRVLTCIALMVVSKGALATCAYMDGRFNPNDVVNINLGTVVVQRDTPVGTVVATVNDSTLGGRNSFIQCTYERFTTQWAAGSAAFTPVSYGGQTLYQSGIPGLAYRVVTAGAGSTAGRYGTGALPRSLSTVACVSSGGNWYRLCGGSWGNYRLQLVKIAATTGSGPLTTGSITQALVAGETNVMNYSITSGSVQTVACSVTNTNITVTMGKAKNTDFSGAGSTSGAANFAIKLNCDASTNVNLTLNPGSAGAADATRGVLNLDNAAADTSASGVGVQLLYNSAPVVPGRLMRIATTVTNGNYDIPLQARYFQTGPKVTPGKADANATFTMTYQ